MRLINLLDKSARENDKTLKDMFGSVEAGSAAMVLASSGGKEYNEILTEMAKSAGSTQKAVDKINSTSAAKMADMLNRVKNKSIELGEKLLPVFEKIIVMVEKAVDWFTSLDEAAQNNIIKFGAYAIAAGPVLKVTGGLLENAGKLSGALKLTGKGFGLLNVGAKTLVPALSGAAKATTAVGAAAGTAGGAAGLGGLITGLGGAAAAIAPFVAGAAAVGIAGYGIHEAITQHATPAVDNLKDAMITTGHTMVEIDGQMVKVAQQTSVKLSEETKKQMKSYYDLSEGAQQATVEMYGKIGPITDQNLKDITDKVEGMANQTKKAIEDQKNKNIADFQELYATSTNLTSEQKSKILEDVTTMAEDRKQKVESMRDRVIELYQQIKEKGVENASEEKKELDTLYQEMAKEQIRAVTQSKNEQELLIQNLTKNKEQMTTKMVEDTIQKFNKDRDEGIKAMEQKYDKMLSAAAKYKTDIELSGKEMTKEQKSNYDAMVRDAEDYKSKTTEHLDNLRNGGIKRLHDAFPELTRQIDIDTGKQLSFLDKLFGGASRNAQKINDLKYEDKSYSVTRNEVTNKITNFFSRVKESISGVFSHRASGIDNVPYDGYKVHLHRGERVLTEKENKEYSRGGNNSPININIEKVENNTKEDVRKLVKRIGDEMKKQNIARGGIQ